MEKQKLLLSLIGFIMSAAMFFLATFAWFTITNENKITPILIEIDQGSITSFQLYVYTLENVYRYESSTGLLLIYNENSSQWETPVYTDPEEQGFNFNGIMMSQYDPLIPANNVLNNIVIELKLNLNLKSSQIATLQGLTRAERATRAINEFQPTDLSFLSQFIFFQYMISNDYLLRADGQNLFLELTDTFAEKDLSDDYIYPLLSFYDTNGLYRQQVSIDSLVLNQNETTLNLYFNISYFEQKIIDTFFTGGISEPTIDGIETIRFFQDIVFTIKFGDIL